MTQPALTLEALRYDPALAAVLQENTSGLILIGTPEGHGRSVIAHAAAIASVHQHGGDLAVVSHEHRYTHDTAVTAHEVTIDGTGSGADINALQAAVAHPGVRTIVYDPTTPQIGGIAYASALARAGWLVLLTIPLAEVENILDAAVNSQTIACYPAIKGGAVLAAEDIANALLAVTTQTVIFEDFEAVSTIGFLPIAQEERLQVVSKWSTHANIVGYAPAI